MLTFYYNLAPNPMKVALFLEEAGLAYEAVPVDTMKGEQHLPAFIALNPNAKVPVIVDGEGDITVFDSNAILLYLAERTGLFRPPPAERGALLSWLMLVAAGVGPFSGQAVHTRHFAPEPKDYFLTRYLFEARRHYSLLDARLAEHEWMVGDAYSIVDMAVWGWARMVPFILGASRTDLSAWDAFPNLKRLMDAIAARPASGRAEALRERHKFKSTLDDEARRAMFPAMA